MRIVPDAYRVEEIEPLGRPRAVDAFFASLLDRVRRRVPHREQEAAGMQGAGARRRSTEPEQKAVDVPRGDAVRVAREDGEGARQRSWRHGVDEPLRGLRPTSRALARRLHAGEGLAHGVGVAGPLAIRAAPSGDDLRRPRGFFRSFIVGQA